MSPRARRFSVWATAVAGVACGVLIVRLGVPHARALAGAWTLVHLSAITALLTLPARGAIRLAPLVSEIVVLGACPVMLKSAAGGAGPGVLLVAALAVLNHARWGGAGSWAAPALGNPWRLAPSLWHPALWLVVLSEPGARGAWLGVVLVPAAQAASVLVRSPRGMVRVAGWAVWGAAAVATVWGLW